MAESFPYQPSGVAPAGYGPPVAGDDAEYSRLVARLKQEQVQLAADQRQLKQQRSVLDRLRIELDCRQRELDAAVQALQQERHLFEERSQSGQRTLDAQQAQLRQQQEALGGRESELRQAEQDLQDHQQQVQARQRDVDAQQHELQSQLEAARIERESLRDRQRSLDERETTLQRQQADLQARTAEFTEQQRQREHDTNDLQGQRDQLQRRQAELQEQFDRRQREALDEVARRETQLAEQSASLAQAQQQIARQQESLRQEQAALSRQQESWREQQALSQARQEDLRRQGQQVQADLRCLREQARAHESQRLALADKEAALGRLQVEMAAARETLRRQQEEMTQRESRLGQKQAELDALQGQLAQRQHSLDAATTIAKDRPVPAADPRLAAAGQEIHVLTRRLQGLQAELEQLRNQKQRALAERDQMAQQCSALQARVDEFMAVQKNNDAVVSSQPSVQTPADDIAVLAAQAAQVRRRVTRADRAAGGGMVPSNIALIAALALSLGLLVGLGLFRMQAGRYWLEAHIVFRPDSALASKVELTRAQRDLGGRLLEARLPGTLWPTDRSPVLADVKGARLTVQLLTVAAEPSKAALQKALSQYRSELEGGIQDAAHSQQDRELADLAVASEMQLKAFAAERQVLQAQAAKFEPQAKAYDSALATAEQARKQLEESSRKFADVAARLRVLRRTPPGTRVELSPERIAAAAASDVQLAEVRGQVTARAGELRTLLASLLGSATKKCDQMDGQLEAFLKFLGGQQQQMTDEALRNETGGIAMQASKLKGIIQRCRKQINDLSEVLAKFQDVARASSLVAVQAQSEKALESLTLEAAEQIKQVDDLLEKIPAGGVDVTRRTVLQQRLRSHFAEVQRTQHEVSETLNGLRPAVNFRLDAALTAVSGLSRRLEDRQKVLLEQIQQQDAQSRRQDYDRQLQQAQAEQDDLSVERERLTSTLTQATQEMLDADAGRTKLIRVRSQIDDVDRKISETKGGLEVAQQKQAKLQSAATQAAVASLDGPEVLLPAVNRGMRMGLSIAAGLVVSVLVFAGYLLAAQSQTRRKLLPVAR